MLRQRRPRIDSQATLCKLRIVLPSFHRRRIRVLLGAAHRGALFCLPDIYKDASQLQQVRKSHTLGFLASLDLGDLATMSSHDHTAAFAQS